MLKHTRNTNRKETIVAMSALAMFSALYLWMDEPTNNHHHIDLGIPNMQHRQLNDGKQNDEPPFPKPQLYTNITHYIDTDFVGAESSKHAEDFSTSQEETKLTVMKNSEPSVIHTSPVANDKGGIIVDVISIGSETRSDYVSIIYIISLTVSAHKMDL